MNAPQPSANRCAREITSVAFPAHGFLLVLVPAHRHQVLHTHHPADLVRLPAQPPGPVEKQLLHLAVVAGIRLHRENLHLRRLIVPGRIHLTDVRVPAQHAVLVPLLLPSPDRATGVLRLPAAGALSRHLRSRIRSALLHSFEIDNEVDSAQDDMACALPPISGLVDRGAIGVSVVHPRSVRVPPLPSWKIISHARRTSPRHLAASCTAAIISFAFQPFSWGFDVCRANTPLPQLQDLCLFIMHKRQILCCNSNIFPIILHTLLTSCFFIAF